MFLKGIAIPSLSVGKFLKGVKEKNLVMILERMILLAIDIRLDSCTIVNKAKESGLWTS